MFLRFLHFWRQIWLLFSNICAFHKLLVQFGPFLRLTYMVGRCVGVHPGLMTPGSAGSNPAPPKILGTSIPEWGFHQSDGALYSARRCNGVHPGLIPRVCWFNSSPGEPLPGAFVRLRLSPDRGGLFSYAPNRAYLPDMHKKSIFTLPDGNLSGRI